MGGLLTSFAGGGIFNKKFRKKAGDFLLGTEDKTEQLSTLDKNQQQLMDLIMQGLQSGEGPLADLFGKFNEEEFNKGVKNPALKSFTEEILPQLNEKFIAGGQVGGSGMQRAQTRAATDLQSKLSELMYGAQQKQKENQIAGVNATLGKPTVENIYKQGQTGALQGFAQGAGNAFGKMAVAG